MTLSADPRRPGIDILISAAPSAALGLWGCLIIVLLSSPIEPYTSGTWGITTLAAIFGLGVLAAVVGRGAAGASGLLLGFAAAVAIQLFVLAGQAVGSIGVVAELVEPPWSERVAATLAAGSTTLLAGYVIAASARYLVTGRGDRQAAAGALPALLGFAGVIVVGGLAVGLLLASVGSSAYVMPADQPMVTLEVNGDEIVSPPPVGLVVGRAGLEVHRTRDGLGDIAISSVLTPADVDSLGSGTILFDQIREGFVGGSTGHREERRQVQFETPGIYAFLVWDYSLEFDAAGFSTVIDAQTFEVGPTPSGAVAAPVDGGAVVRVAGAMGVLVAGWSAAGSVLMARRGRWVHRGRPGAGDLRVAIAIGTVSALALGALALLFIDLARDPF